MQLNRRDTFSLLGAMGLTIGSINESKATDIQATRPTGTLYRGKLKSGVTYEHITINSKGLPGVVSKVYGGYIKGIATKFNQNMLCKLQNPIDHYKAAPAPLMFNSSAAKSTGQILGPQIQNSVVLKDFDGKTANHRGIVQLGFDQQGNARLYNNLRGDTVETMRKNGVHTSYGFGPPLVENGKAILNANDPIFGLFNFVSGRQVFGVDIKGNVMLLTINGVSKKSGLGINETALFAVEKGFYQATMLDSGGSAQTVLNGKVLHPSTDSSGARPIPDMGVINATITETTVGKITSFDDVSLSDFEIYYQNNGGEAKFGKPREDIWTSVDGGRIQNYTGLYCFYSNNKDGVHSVYTKGAIGQYYASKRWELGHLGYPVTDELPGENGSMYQDFKNGNGDHIKLFWSEQTGTHELNVRGAIYWRWNTDGGVAKYGSPVTNEYSVGNGGVAQDFTNAVVVWAPFGTGTHVINRGGAIHNKWLALGTANVGCPTTDEVPEANGGASVVFTKPDNSRVKIYWSSKTGAQKVVDGGALHQWLLSNGGVARNGYPTHDERLESDGYVHLRFSSGLHLKWSESRGVQKA